MKWTTCVRWSAKLSRFKRQRRARSASFRWKIRWRSTFASRMGHWARSYCPTRPPRPSLGNRRRRRTKPPTYADEDAYVVMGTNGSLAVPTMRLKRYPRKEDRSWFEPFHSETIPLQRTDPLAAQIEHFVAVIRGSADPLVTARDGLQNLRVTDAILEAARTGATVKISAKEA